MMQRRRFERRAVARVTPQAALALIYGAACLAYAILYPVLRPLGIAPVALLVVLAGGAVITAPKAYWSAPLVMLSMLAAIMALLSMAGLRIKSWTQLHSDGIILQQAFSYLMAPLLLSAGVEFFRRFDHMAGRTHVSILGKAANQIRRHITRPVPIHFGVGAEGRLASNRTVITTATPGIGPYNSVTNMQWLVRSVLLSSLPELNDPPHNFMPRH